MPKPPTKRHPLRTLPPRVPTLSHAPRELKPATLHDEERRDRSRAYERLRLQVLREANYLCQCSECIATQRLRHAMHVDHIVPLWAGGSASDRANLQALSVECHKRKSAREHQLRLGLATTAQAPRSSTE